MKVKMKDAFGKDVNVDRTQISALMNKDYYTLEDKEVLKVIEERKKSTIEVIEKVIRETGAKFAEMFPAVETGYGFNILIVLGKDAPEEITISYDVSNNSYFIRYEHPKYEFIRSRTVYNILGVIGSLRNIFKARKKLGITNGHFPESYFIKLNSLFNKWNKKMNKKRK